MTAAPTRAVVVTGARGFLGRNLRAALARRSDVSVTAIDLDSPPGALEDGLARADLVFHLAGVNRPDREEDFAGNADSAAAVCAVLRRERRKPTLILSSSIQAERDNPYGRSKLAAEHVVRGYADESRAEVVVYRLKNLFGKWCQPNYNSVVATFCHSIARGLPVTMSDPANVVDLTYVDHVVDAFMTHVGAGEPGAPGFRFAAELPSTRRTLSELVELIESFRDQRTTLRLPDFSDRFVVALYATYLSHLESDAFAYDLQQRADARGVLAEFIKGGSFGQIFVSRTNPGFTRGNHYHDSKCEKFLVLEGQAVVRFRHLVTSELIEYPVSGEQFRVVDIPPGYTHSIENIGSGVLVTLFWANEILDMSRPDAHYRAVLTDNDTP